MTTTTEKSNETQAETSNRPDWIAKAPKGYGRKQRLVRIGAAWNREDGGVCVRFVGTQIIDEDVYLYPATDAPEGDV